MIQRGRCPRLLLEAAKPLGIAGDRGRQYLDRHIASKPRIMRAVHLTHTARSDERMNLIRAEMRACCESHGCAREL